jgi:RNA polymerase sigma-70 factor (ECF subfamily)
MRQDDRSEEQRLIAETKKGDTAAFESLVKMFQNRIYYLSLRMTGTHAAADDVAQETFIRAFFALSSFRDGMSFYGWIRKIAVNVGLNYLKAKKREEPLGEREPASAALPQDELLKNEMDIRFHSALQALPFEQREVFLLRVQENLSYREIARILHLSRGTVMSRLSRARRKLRSELANFIERRRS